MRRFQSIYRHSLAVRVTHWINVLCLIILLMSGLQIFNAHPALYWGDRAYFSHPLLLMDATQTNGGPIGITTIFGHAIDTTGLFGLSYDADGNPDERGFPSWATIPSYQDLADGRRWHFFFAWLFVLNGLFYIVHAAVSGHLSRDLVPTRRQLVHKRFLFNEDGSIGLPVRYRRFRPLRAKLQSRPF